jgi:hypothetical protein
MTNREITTLMHRLFPTDLGPIEYVHLMVDDRLNSARLNALLDYYIPGDEVLIFGDRNHCVSSSRELAFDFVQNFMQHGRVRIADPQFRGRVIIEPLGVGGGTLASAKVLRDICF